MDFTDIFQAQRAKIQAEQDALRAQSEADAARLSLNADHLQAHVQSVIMPVVHAACRDGLAHGHDLIVEALRGASTHSVGLQLTYRNHQGPPRHGIARLVYKGSPETLGIKVQIEGHGIFKTAGEESEMTLDQCTTGRVTEDVRRFLKTVLGL